MSQYQNVGNPLLGLAAGRQAVRPSEVIPPGGVVTDSAEGPCPFCGTLRLDNPTGTQWATEWHCWKCGYQPSVTSGVSQWERRQQFERFEQWLASQMAPDVAHPTLNPPPETSEVADMQAKIAALEAAIAKQNGG